MVVNPRKPTDTEWGVMRDMYCQGMTPARIAQATGVFEGTIASKASRAGWKEVREAVRRALPDKAQVTVRLQSQADKDDKAAGNRARAQLGRVIEACVAKLCLPKTQAQALALQRELTPLVNNAARVFAWADRPDPVINLALIDRACLLSSANPATNVPQGTLSDQGSVRTINTPALGVPPEQVDPGVPQAQLAQSADSAIVPAVPPSTAGTVGLLCLPAESAQDGTLASTVPQEQATLILGTQQGP